MAKFRKKPVVIEAFRLTEASRADNRDWPVWLNEARNKHPSEVGAVSPWEIGCGTGPLRIITLEGLHRCDLGDWIIRGVKGELYPCKPDIFAATHEPVDEGLATGDGPRG